MENYKIKARATNNAYALLRQRPRSEFEIRSRLKMKGYSVEVVDVVLESLRRSGEIDDTRFAKLWVDSRMRANPAGDVVLRYELKEKGLSDSIIESALAKKSEEYDEYTIALEMARERFGRLKKIEPRKALKRVYDFMLRRGFKYETVRKVTDELVNQGSGGRVQGSENNED
ncbi:MAG: regulatory protein RecX [Candidatus Omnitrophota bacterium]|nr:regulatory protein RecX [Candidatus Omnitrophota bacterium]